MPTELLLYTARAEHDALGHAIARFSRGTFTHAALYRDGVLVEAVIPRVRRLEGDAAAQGRAGASEVVRLQPFSEELAGQVWDEMVDAMVGQGYSVSTLVSDFLGNLFGFRPIVRLGGEVVCSMLAGQYCQLIGDPRVPRWVDVGSMTPADLGLMFTGRRLPQRETST